jgi:hypothetical protein
LTNIDKAIIEYRYKCWSEIMTKTESAALPAAEILLVILRVLNALAGFAVFLLLIATVAAEQWTMRALGIATDSMIVALLNPLRAIAALGVFAFALNHVVIGKLLEIVGSVRTGDPFVAANADRIRAIGWLLVALQLVSIAIAAIGKAASTPERPLNLDAGPSIEAWLAIIITFVLARVFAEGTRMRSDLEGTV